MSDLFPREEQPAGEAEHDQRIYTRLLDERPKNYVGPWCRVCQKEADWWFWEKEDVDWRRCTVDCHGQDLIVRVPIYVPIGMFRMEVFCYEQPRMQSLPNWWVRFNGSTIQESYEHIDYATQRGGFYASPGADYLRKISTRLFSMDPSHRW